jgi:Zn-dependent protease
MDNFSQLILMIVPLLFAVTIHEVAHGYVAYRLGDPTAKLAGRLTLNPVKHLDPVGSFLLPLILKLSGSPIVFGYAKPVPVNFTNLRDYRMGTIWVASAGVITNMICAIVSGILFQSLIYLADFAGHTAITLFFSPALNMLAYSVIINLVLAVFNMIPVPPLDGSRILAMLMPIHLRMQFQKLERYGMFILILLLMTKSLDKIISFFVTPLGNFLLGT